MRAARAGVSGTIMSDDILGDRRRALEEDFFRRQDADLVARRRDEGARHAARAALATASGITDEALLDRLVEMGITTETVIALSLVPVIDVAWADGRIDAREKDAILAAARTAGLAPDGPGARMVEGCLARPPSPELRAAWRHYIENVCATLTVAERRALRDEIVRQGRAVAEATGGFKGLFSRVSAQEAAVLDEIAGAFRL